MITLNTKKNAKSAKITENQRILEFFNSLISIPRLNLAAETGKLSQAPGAMLAAQFRRFYK